MATGILSPWPAVTMVSRSGQDLALMARSAAPPLSATISDWRRSSGLVLLPWVGLLARLLRLAMSLVSELSQRLMDQSEMSIVAVDQSEASIYLMECRNTEPGAPLLCTRR